jgi:tryptophan halogenase
MSAKKTKVVIVGGGTAGWLTAGILASRFASEGQQSMQITLIESPDVQTIGVGEGTWPSMRTTLQKMGISETEFMRDCDVSLKQGTRFDGWARGGEESDDYYYHPFSLPQGFSTINLAKYWQVSGDQPSSGQPLSPEPLSPEPLSPELRNHQPRFADAVGLQSSICHRGLAPKQITTPEFAFNANYGYHLDAGKFAVFLNKHCTNKLDVKHILDHVISVNADDDGYIESIDAAKTGTLEGDLFVDCTGFASILLGQHYGIKLQDKRDVLFNDSAIAVHVPYQGSNDPVLSHTLSTAQSAGWIWDIGLPTRRGVGYVYSSDHTSDDAAHDTLMNYVSSSVGSAQAKQLVGRKIPIKPGYREKFWHKNCVAIGLSAGFVEPMEASALVLVELSAQMLAEQFPADRPTMNIVAQRFNQKFTYRWEQIIDFLKLHYVLTKRKDSDYWLDNCRSETIPESLQQSLQLWKTQVPWHFDTPHIDEMFPSASFQYVLYGMGFVTEANCLADRSHKQMSLQADALMQENQKQIKKLLSVLPHNRDLLNKVAEFGFQKI